MLVSACVWVMLCSCWFAMRRPWADQRLIKPAWAPIVLWLLVTCAAVAQMIWPVLLDMGQRSAHALDQGQIWRLVTSLFLQDGGLVGAVFNVLTLAITFVLAAPLLSARAIVVIFSVGGVGGNLLSWLLLGADGAGNSIATVAVATAAAILALRYRPGPENDRGADGEAGGGADRGAGGEVARNAGAGGRVAATIPLIALAVAAAASGALADNHWCGVVMGAAAAAVLWNLPQAAGPSRSG